MSGMFRTRAELEQWAQDRGVTHALSISTDVLLAGRLQLSEAQRGQVRYAVGGLALRDVGSEEGALRYVAARGRELAQRLPEAVLDYLREEAEHVEAGCREESLRAETLAAPAPLPILYEKLQAIRRRVRGSAVARSRAGRASGEWGFDSESAAITWSEPVRIVRKGPLYGTVGVRARLSFSPEGANSSSCNCDAREASCVHVLALIDTTLDVLENEARRTEALALAEALLSPGWARALKALAGLETPEKPRDAVEIGWRIEHEFGALTLSPIVRKKNRQGSLSPGARVTPTRLLEEFREHLSSQDLRAAELLAMWLGAPRVVGTYPSRAFQALIGHPRVSLESPVGTRVTLSTAPLGFAAEERGEHIELSPSLSGEPFAADLLSALLETFAPDEPLLHVDPEQERCVLIEIGEGARQLWKILQRHGTRFPPESHAPLLERLAVLERRLPLSVPASLKGRELPPQPTTVIRLRLLPDVTLELELFLRPGPGAPIFHPGAGPRDVLLQRDGERAYVRRSLGSEEARVRSALSSLPLADAEEGPPFCFRLADTDAALSVISALQTPREGVEVEWLDAPAQISSASGPEAIQVKVERKRDWFGLSGGMKVEAGHLELAVLLDAARRQQRFVRLDSHRWVELSDRLRQRLLAIADHTFSGRSGVEVSPGAVSALEQLRHEGAQVDAAPSWQLLAERLTAAHSLRPKPPTALKATLRDYQLEGHAWLSRVAAWGAGACLADDMGLGKTIQALAVLVDRTRIGPALVLAPTSVGFNWVEEIRRFAPTLRPLLYSEQPDRERCLARLARKDVLIVSYGLLARDIGRLAEISFATLVIDEAQALKNPSTRRARAARAINAGFRIALTGTPLENHLGELWSLYSIVFPGLLGSWDQFRERFAAPVERGKDPEAGAALSRVLRPFLLRRTKDEVARELPSRTEIRVPVALSEEEWSLYEGARLAAVAELSAQGKGIRNEEQRFQVLAALTRLRLLASHPKLYDAHSKVASSKMRRLLELLDEVVAGGHRALVFSQFTSHLALVKEALDRAGHRYLYLDGGTAAGARAKRIQAFQAGEGAIFLISLKAGGTGINLTGADYVIHLDPWWNPAVEDQATDRAHRIGQTRPVTVYRLVSRGTIEEQILSLHEDKRALVTRVLEGTNVAARLSTRDLLGLLQGGAAPIADEQEGRDEAPPKLVH